jgi:hypothetical protein
MDSAGIPPLPLSAIETENPITSGSTPITSGSTPQSAPSSASSTRNSAGLGSLEQVGPSIDSFASLPATTPLALAPAAFATRFTSVRFSDVHRNYRFTLEISPLPGSVRSEVGFELAFVKPYSVSRSYGDFKRLHKKVLDQVANAPEGLKVTVPKLPKRKWVVTPAVCEERKIALAAYVKDLFLMPEQITKCLFVAEFFGIWALDVLEPESTEKVVNLSSFFSDLSLPWKLESMTLSDIIDYKEKKKMIKSPKPSKSMQSVAAALGISPVTAVNPTQPTKCATSLSETSSIAVPPSMIDVLSPNVQDASQQPLDALLHHVKVESLVQMASQKSLETSALSNGPVVADSLENGLDYQSEEDDGNESDEPLWKIHTDDEDSITESLAAKLAANAIVAQVKHEVLEESQPIAIPQASEDHAASPPRPRLVLNATKEGARITLTPSSDVRPLAQFPPPPLDSPPKAPSHLAKLNMQDVAEEKMSDRLVTVAKIAAEVARRAPDASVEQIALAAASIVGEQEEPRLDTALLLKRGHRQAASVSVARVSSLAREDERICSRDDLYTWEQQRRR